MSKGWRSSKAKEKSKRGKKSEHDWKFHQIEFSEKKELFKKFRVINKFRVGPQMNDKISGPVKMTVRGVPAVRSGSVFTECCAHIV